MKCQDFHVMNSYFLFSQYKGFFLEKTVRFTVKKIIMVWEKNVFKTLYVLPKKKKKNGVGVLYSIHSFTFLIN